MNDAPIGIFDSGVGGLTVARAIGDQLPRESLVYIGDTLHSPYGPKPIADVRRYSLEVLDSLVDQGVLDRPSAPLLCVNGVDDSIFPIEDMYLLLRHGSAKSARFFPGGHMGHDPTLFPTIVAWITRELSRR